MSYYASKHINKHITSNESYKQTSQHKTMMSPLQWQQAIGNQQTYQVMQRMKDKSGQLIPLDLNHLSLLHIENICALIKDGEFIASQKEKSQLKQHYAELKKINRKRKWVELDTKDDINDKDYEPEPHPNIQEAYDTLEPRFRAKMKAKNTGKKLSGKKVQGDFLEFSTTMHAQDMGIAERDANTFSMNMPGIDHIIDHKHYPFVQDKMHLSQHTANIESYRAHYVKREEMATKLLKTSVSDGKRGTDIRAMFDSVLSDKTWIHRSTIQTIRDKITTFRLDYQNQLESTNPILPNIEDDETLINMVRDSIAFTVPSDIWEALYAEYVKGKIPKKEITSYIRLDVETSDFAKLLEMLSHVAAPWNERKPRLEDEEYTGKEK